MGVFSAGKTQNTNPVVQYRGKLPIGWFYYMQKFFICEKVKPKKHFSKPYTRDAILQASFAQYAICLSFLVWKLQFNKTFDVVCFSKPRTRGAKLRFFCAFVYFVAQAKTTLNHGCNLKGEWWCVLVKYACTQAGASKIGGQGCDFCFVAN